jgi:hypothetical protein
MIGLDFLEGIPVHVAHTLMPDLYR